MNISQTLIIRLKASAIHFAISLAVFLILLSFIVFIWYPSALFWVDGGITGVQILVAVDLVLGPLLTLVIFNPTKTRRHIIMDFMVIAAIQISALSWGVNVIYGERPVSIVFDGTNFQIMDNEIYQKQEISISSLNRENEELPLVFYARKPETEKEGSEVVHQLFNNSIPDWAVVSLHEPISHYLLKLKAESDKTKRKYRENPLLMSRHQAILQDSGVDDGSLLLPLNGRFGEALVVLNVDGVMIDSFLLD